jgi:tetratricopeptide (TPR) repeat protein
VLEGSVRRAGNNLRITAQLIDAVTDIHLWAEKYTGTLDDIFDIQETVSRTIVDALKVELTPQEDRRIADRATENVDVFECYHRAHSDLQTWSLPGIQRARVDLEKGLETFGEHADLYFELGHAHVMAYDLGIEPTAETLQRAEECAKKGLQLGPESPNSHYLFGMIERSRGNTIQAIRYLERFLAMEPDSSDGLFWLGTMYTFAGRTGAGLRMARRLLQVDPLYARTHLALGLAYQADGKIEPALAAMEKNAFLEPESATPPFWIAITLLQNNELQKASDLIDKFAPSVDKLERHFVEIALFARHAVRQEKDRAYSVLSDATRRFLWADPYLPWLVAGFFAVLGEHDESIRWLERLIELGFFNYPLLAEIDPTYESIRGDERFQRLMNEIKPKWESFEVGLDLSRYPPAE